jgi:hypothetical protein
VYGAEVGRSGPVRPTAGCEGAPDERVVRGVPAWGVGPQMRVPDPLSKTCMCSDLG